ncbi:MAG: FmdB family zinc ribbon protein [Longimicrobiales bacterium]
MPYYEYRCAANGRTVEVRHTMSERLETWGEVVAAAGIERGETPPDAAVERLMSAASVGSAADSASNAAGPGPGSGFGGCGPGCACGH